MSEDPLEYGMMNGCGDCLKIDQPGDTEQPADARIARLEREFPRTTKIGKVFGKVVRGICAFFYSVGYALVTEDKKKKPAKKTNNH